MRLSRLRRRTTHFNVAIMLVWAIMLAGSAERALSCDETA
jgi:hypothetical protein